MAKSHDNTEVALLSGYTITATEAAATASTPIVCGVASLIFFTVEVTTKGAITDLQMSFEARTEDGQEWSPVFVEDITAGVATLSRYITLDDVSAAGLTAPFRRIYRVPAWAHEVRCYVWGTAAAGTAEANVFGLRR